MMSQARFLRGLLLIAAVYFYFLIFAQFAFLELVRSFDSSEAHLQVIMGAMAAGGITGSFLVPVLVRANISLPSLLRAGLTGSALVGASLQFSLSWPSAAAILIGLALGVTTVALASILRTIFTESNWAWGSALGTGLAYVAANLPFIFQASPRLQTIDAAIVAACAAWIVPAAGARTVSFTQRKGFSLQQIPWAILFFGILVWFDSAAFYIIQHSELKSGTWAGASDLWRNAFMHLLGALAGAFLMKRFRFLPALVAALVLLAAGGLAANHAESRPFSGWLYPAGVSIYSACLVAFPAFGTPTLPMGRVAWLAATLYAFSGWVCSGLGIGMAQNLGRVPWQFVAASAAALGLPFLWIHFRKSRREYAYAVLIVGAAGLASSQMPPTEASLIGVELGRATYLAEGCINCHSQFVRPGTRDETLWGPARSVKEFEGQSPPLFGNRRHGPDLANIGNRRSREWLKLHFLSPRILAPGSSMPAYEYLFRDGRGNALIDYLLSLKSELPRDTWIQEPVTNCPSDLNIGQVFSQHCGMCHSISSGTESPKLARAFARPPPNLAAGPFVFASQILPSETRKMQIARIIKFGIAGTDMPGHEYFPDQMIFALSDFIENLSRDK